MRILLIYPNANTDVLSWADTGAIAEPIALEYIGAAAGEDGHDVRLLDLRLHLPLLERTIIDYNPDVIGVTGYSMHVRRNLAVCRQAKELIPTCRTVVGGHHATLEPVDFFEKSIDFVVMGEGTGPFRKILKHLSDGHSEPAIPGVYTRVNGTFQFGGDPQPLQIDAIPCPDRTLAAADRQHYFIDWMKPIAMFRTSVGCPFRCSFCSLWRIMNGRYHTRNLDAVVEELGTIPENFLFFVDDEPFVNPKRMKTLADKIEKAGLQKTFFSYCRIDSILKDVDLMKQWKEIGLKRLLIGVETIFDKESSAYNKRQTRDQVMRGIQAANTIGIQLLCNFIVHPNYTEKDFEALIRFIRENGVDFPSFTIWTPLPGIGFPDNRILVRQPNGRPDWDYFDLQHPVIQTRLPKQEFMRHFENLYQTFIDKYLASGSPLTVKAMEDRKKALKDPMVALAAKVLGMGKRPISSD